MVAVLVQLKLRLLGNSLKRSPWMIVGMVFGGLYALFLVICVLIGLFALLQAPTAVANTILVLAGSVIILGWWVIPVFFSGVDNTLDPQRFTTYAIPPRQLLWGLGLAALVGIPGLATAVIALGASVPWLRNPASCVAALVGAVLILALCVTGSRALTTLVSNVTSSRRFKDATAVVFIVPLMLLGPIFAGIIALLRSSFEALPSVANILSFTPLGAPWAIPGDIDQGQWGLAALKALITVASVLILAWVWKISMFRAMVNPPQQSARRRSAGKLGWFTRLPGTPWGSVAAREFTYFIRDPRYSASFISALIIPIILVLPAMQSQNFYFLIFAGSFVTLTISSNLGLDISYDSTAFSLHVATGVSGRDDRLGRAVAYAALSLPVAVIYSVLAAVISGDWWLFPAIIGLSLAAGLVGLGVGLVVSAVMVFSVAQPGQSIFKSRPGVGFTEALRQMVSLSVAVLLLIPVIICVVLAVATDQALWSWLSLGSGLLVGSICLLVGLRYGASLYDRRAPKLLEMLHAQI